jgi:hypothetical protein
MIGWFAQFSLRAPGAVARFMPLWGIGSP